MKWISISGACAVFALAGSAVLAQQPEQPLLRVPDRGERPLTRWDPSGWERDLLASDLDQREANFDRLVREATQNPDLRETLRLWSSDTRRPDLAWSARLALRELRLRQTQSPFGGSLSAPGFGQQRDPMALFDELQRELDSMLGNRSTPGPGGSGSDARSKQFRFESGPNGVRVHLDQDVNGERTTQTFEAATLDELLEAHPELREHFQNAPHLGTPFAKDPGPRIRSLLEGLRPDRRLQKQPAGSLPTHVLGVLMRPYDGPANQGVPEGTGMIIDRIVPGTIAQVLGLRRGDVLLSVNGTPIANGADVSSVLERRLAHENIVVTLIDGRGERQTKTWTPTIAGDEK